jgi:hypothetical protein
MRQRPNTSSRCTATSSGAFCRYALDCYAECCDGEYSLVSRHTRPRSGIHVNAANVFVRCRIYSLLCGSIARPVFVLLDDPLSFFWPKKKVSKEKARPASPLMARNAIDVTRGILPFCLARFASNGAASVPRK